jgi:hypothetical protein
MIEIPYYPTGSVGVIYADSPELITYSIVSVDGTVVVAETNIGVEPADLLGNFHVPSLVNIPADTNGREIWYYDGEAVAEGVINLGVQYAAMIAMKNALISSQISSSILEGVRRGDTFIQEVSGLLSLEDVDEIWFTIKLQHSQQDNESIIQVSMTGGLLYVNAASPSLSSLASLAITDEEEGNINITIDETITALLSPGPRLYDIQAKFGSNIYTLKEGTIQINPDVTRRVS